MSQKLKVGWKAVKIFLKPFLFLSLIEAGVEKSMH